MTAVALVSFCLPVADASAEVVAEFNFDAGSRVSTATSALATAGNFTHNSLNTNQHTVSTGLSNSFTNAGYSPFNSANAWASTLAPSGTNVAGSGGLSGVNELNIWKGFTVTKAPTIPSLNFEKISFKYGASGSGVTPAVLASMSMGVYFRETGSTGDFTLLGTANASAIGTGAGVGGDISGLATQEIVFAQPFASNGGQFRFYFRDNVSPDASSFTFSQTHRLDSISLTAVPEPSSMALLGLVGTAAVARRRMKKAKA
jgi:hypothetical protein